MNSLLLSGNNAMFHNDQDRRRQTFNRTVNNMHYLKQMLIDAISHEEFDLVYQPQTDMSGMKVIGVEALIRWYSPEHGDISPVDFIPLAEKLNLISEIGDIVIRKSCEQLAHWKALYNSELRMAINVSYMQMHSHRIIETLDENMTRYGLGSGDLEIELTESTLLRDKAYVIKILNELNEMGVRTAIDDFGTGYSSLNHLASMPFDMLKIDRSFISNLERNKASRTVTQSIISLGKSLDMEVLAEGVETELQKYLLSQHGCDLIQGSLISMPLAANDIPLAAGMRLC